MLPKELPPFYHKKMLTIRHSSIGGVSTASWRFVHYTRWEDVISPEAVALDLSHLQSCERHFWVLAQSVFTQKPVLRQVKIAELMAIWDYEGKLESRGWSREQCLRILHARLLSPPGKILSFIQAVCDAILLQFYSTAVQPPKLEPRTSTRGLTSDIPFSPLEAKVTTHVSAAQTDFAEVDLTVWSSPLETDEEFHPRVILRQFAV